ncbi:hypothetical protein J3Q64DRAFT_1841374 [Phycomyces blakesleeanus]|uniref:Uncharacterized protein n=2 Tax=Phycomyces blakesleeanus TaxID=4837 RepID=A0A162N724_PHYB8|nr:hypothetical protein PHYBLDRAFT_152436 [Phycomyces blakesleeanus NRRL 1555(-)]OAD66364.1 hypothetical protein PHYBLDRAFT_152436 [Phycomyces blakesleeanus NRRL 1555(-)]|eukprot:XP_018284404.1 hypothetical protein PHYBLDRAFT_152436 [Phycomyces blakesleeanus NRRL 1555(-)]
MNVYLNEDSSRQTSYRPNDFADIFTGLTHPFKLKMVLDVREEAGVALDFPTPNAVINYHKQKKNQIPVFSTASFDVVNQDNERHVL